MGRPSFGGVDRPRWGSSSLPPWLRIWKMHQPERSWRPGGEQDRPPPAVGKDARVRGRLVIIIDVLVVHGRPQQFRRLQGALGVGPNVVGVFVEVAVDQVDRLVLGIVIGLALFRSQLGLAVAAANRSAHPRMHETGWPGRHSVEPFGLSSSILTSNGPQPRGAQFAILVVSYTPRLGTSHGIATGLK
jgi:hypothetical protein